MSSSLAKYRIGRLRLDRIYVLDAIEEDKNTFQEQRVMEWRDELRSINQEITRLMAVAFA
jgi:hypothetical protein